MNENRTYKKGEGGFRDAKLLLIICEGQREEKYFTSLKNMHNRDGLFIEVASQKDNHSSINNLIPKAKEKSAELGLVDDDYVYFVVDTDRPEDIPKLEALANDETHPNWHTAFSSPCFETWLLYHIEPNIKGLAISIDENKPPCKILKSQVHTLSSNRGISTGYKPVTFCKLADQAMINAKNAYTDYSVPIPNYLETQVFDLADLIINRNKDFQPLF